MEANCALVIAASAQAFATIILVLVTGWYAKKTAEATKRLAEEGAIERKKNKIKGHILEQLLEPFQTSPPNLPAPTSIGDIESDLRYVKKDQITKEELSSLLYEMVRECIVEWVRPESFRARIKKLRDYGLPVNE